jgi:hypothetical protein
VFATQVLEDLSGRTVFRGGLQKALKVLAVGGLLPTRLGASPVLAGLVPAIHAAPAQRRVQEAPHVVAMAAEITLFLASLPLAVALCAETRG